MPEPLAEKWTILVQDPGLTDTTDWVAIPGGRLYRTTRRSSKGDVAVALCFVPNSSL
jgi:hypothetical protein